MKHRVAATLTLLVLAARPGGVRAQSQDEPARIAEARQHFGKAREHYNLGEYDQAIVELKEAYRLWKQPLLLFNIAQAYRLQGDCAQAMTFYRSYLREQPQPPNLGEVEAAMTLCASAEKAPPQPREDQTTHAPPPQPAPVPVETDPDEDDDEPVDITRPSFVRRHLGSLVAGGAAVVLAGTGTALGLASWSEYQDLAERCVGVSCPEDDVGGVERKVLFTNLAWGAAGVAAVTSAVLYLFFEKDASNYEPNTDTALIPTANGASLMVRF